MKTIIHAALIFAAIQVVLAAEQEPLRDPMKEGGHLWEWDAFYRAVIIVRGTIKETSKERPDISIQGPYSAWSELTAPSLANTPTENGFYLLITRMEVQEVIYTDPSLLHVDANINWLIDGRSKAVNCILGAELKQIGEPDDRGRSKYVYRLRDLEEHEDIAKKEMIFILGYLDIYPIQGLYLKSYTSAEQLKYIRRLAAYRNERGQKTEQGAAPNPRPTGRSDGD